MGTPPISPTTKLCWVVSALSMLCWIISAPGPKHEEVYVVGFFTALVLIPAFVNSLASPSLKAVPVLHSATWLIGWAGWQTRYAQHYDYAVLDLQRNIHGAKWLAGLFITLLVANAASAYVHQRFRRQKHSPQ